MGSLVMPDHLRKELSSEAFGTLLNGSPADNASKAIEMIGNRKPTKVVIVGDFTLNAFLSAGYVPDLGIFDRLTRRMGCDFPAVKASAVKNPAGEITDEAVGSIKKALSPRQRRKVMLRVEGEEDLLALPAITYAPIGSLVIYGLPDRGMLVVTADSPTKKKIASMISQFEKRG